jgi:hypothetical protein
MSRNSMAIGHTPTFSDARTALRKSPDSSGVVRLIPRSTTGPWKCPDSTISRVTVAPCEKAHDHVATILLGQLASATRECRYGHVLGQRRAGHPRQGCGDQAKSRNCGLSHDEVERPSRHGAARQEQNRPRCIRWPRSQNLPGLPHGYLLANV